MVTIYDVAKKAMVSPATVSRVLNNRDNVNAETRRRIEKVFKELKYVPNTNAGSLKKKTTKTLALIIPDIPNPFFISILNGFEQRAIKGGYSTILCNTNQRYDKEKDYINIILEKRIDGVAISTMSKNSKHMSKIVERKIPFILIDRKIKDFRDKNVDIVCGDSFHGAVKLVEHLIERGHRKIAMISAPLHLSTSKERVEGYKEALKDASIQFNPELLKIDNTNEGFSKDKAYEMTKQLIQSNINFSAIFVANNLMALGTYKALNEANYKIPEDIALVCFEELNNWELKPFFTVMRQPAYTMGNIAAEILINKIEGDYENNTQKVILKPELVVRDSS